MLPTVRAFTTFVLALLVGAACTRPAPGLGTPTAPSDDASAWRRTVPIIDVHGHIDPGAIHKTLRRDERKLHIADGEPHRRRGCSRLPGKPRDQSNVKAGGVGSSST